MIKNIKKIKAKHSDFYFEGIALKNEDESPFDPRPAIETHLGYYPLTGVMITENKENFFEVTTSKKSLKAFDYHILLKFENGKYIWTKIKDLKVDDFILTINGIEKIESITKSNEIDYAFDFRVEGTQCFLTNGIVSHNSMIALSMMRQSDIDLIVYWDSEGGGVSIDFANFLGINPKKVLYSQIETVEDLKKKMQVLIDIVEKNKLTKKILLVIDSISMLSTEKEIDPNAGADMGYRAKTTRSFFRQYARKMQTLNIAAVFTAHLTDNIGGYGPSKVVSGGTILGYAPSAEIRFAKVNAESETEQSAKGTSLVKIRADMIKSRFETTGKRVKFDLNVAKGLDAYSGIFNILQDYEFVIPAAKDVEEQIKEKNIPKKSTGWWMFKPWGNKEVASLYKRLIDENITSDSGKFREDDIKEYCKEHEWFLPTIQSILDTIYEDEIIDAPQAEETVEEATDTSSKKKKKKAEKEEVSEPSNDESIGSDVVIEETTSDDVVISEE